MISHQTLPHVPDRTAAKYFRNGRMLLELGLPEKAKGRFEAAIEELPKYPAAHYQLGLLHKAGGRPCQRVGTLSLCGGP